MIRAELPGLDPENDIEVTVEGRVLTIRAERRQQENGPCGWTGHREDETRRVPRTHPSTGTAATMSTTTCDG